MKYKKRPLCLLLSLLLCLAMTLPAFAGGTILGGHIQQNGQRYELDFNDDKGDGWSAGNQQVMIDNSRHYQGALTLDNFEGEEISLFTQEGDIVLILADGSVNRTDVLSCFLSDGDTFSIQGNGTLIIGELQMPDDNGGLSQTPLDLISIAEGATVTVGETAEEEWTYDEEPVPVIYVELDDDDEYWTLPFTDVPDDAYYWDAVRWAIDDGVTKGTSDTTFSPDAACTRGQVATFLWRAYHCPEPKTTVNPFTDVSESSPFYKAILWAAERRITTGTSETTFSPGDTCTNAHVITFLWRFMYQPQASRASALADSLPQGYYTDAVRWADGADVLSETRKAFDPSAPCPRADIVHYLYRAFVDIDAPAIEVTH